MYLVTATIRKLESVISLIRSLKASEFPHSDSQSALDEIERIFVSHQDFIRNELDPGSDPRTVAAYCNSVYGDLGDFLPFLGFIHHSKNPTNALELYGPLLRLARALIAPEARLVLSSEWELSPFTMVGVTALPHFVWVGLPASESSNALLAPLAGHEFGHSIWFKEKYGDRYKPDIEKGILRAITARFTEYQRHFDFIQSPDMLVSDVFGLMSWRPAFEWAMRQAEEAFCDFVGLRVFGESYLHAFAYLLAPGSSERGTPFYPSLRARANYMSQATI